MLLDFFSALFSSFFILAGIWLITLIIVFITLFKRDDIEMPAKTMWGIIIFMFPVLGLIAYLMFGLRKRKKLLDVDKKIIG